MPIETGGTARFDVNDPEDLSVLISSGAIWKGGPKSQALAIDALVTGTVAVTQRTLLTIPANVLAEVQRRREEEGHDDLAANVGFDEPEAMGDYASTNVGPEDA